MITIALADDHTLVREGLASLLEEEPNFKIVAQCSNGRELVAVVEQLRPQVAVVDISMPELNGIDAARQIRKISPSTRIIALSVYTDESYVRDMVEAGVSGYVVKAGAAKDLVDAIKTGSRGRVYFSDEIADSGHIIEAQGGQSKNHPAHSERSLSSREREILQMIGEGFSSREIADKLEISETTVKTHRNNLMDKLNVRDIAGLTRQAIRLRLVHLE